MFGCLSGDVAFFAAAFLGAALVAALFGAGFAFEVAALFFGGERSSTSSSRARLDLGVEGAGLLFFAISGWTQVGDCGGIAGFEISAATGRSELGVGVMARGELAGKC